MSDPSDAPRGRGLCPHSRVMTLCPICRDRIPTASPGVRRASPTPGRRPPAMATSAADARMMKAPVARGACSVCKTEGTARELVQDVEFRQYLCRAHAKDSRFERVLFDRSGRQDEAVNPSAEEWATLLEDPGATLIRVYRGRTKPTPRPPSQTPGAPPVA